MEDMQTVRQWSLRSGVPYRTLLDAVRNGDLPSLRFKERGQIFITTEDFQRWVEEAKHRAVTQTDDPERSTD